MAKSEKRIIFGLKCPECNEKNYTTTKNKQNSTEKLNLKKYCPRCAKHTLHKEVK
ncbi:MAG TPA: 50S ribosomal protein L33 [Candidatus Aminicenantes bacterium]|nr:50S ribosomal protein L33 [Candidatus Aminicenantes bacterium]